MQAAIRAYYRFIDGDDRAHRLVFESGLINGPDVSARLEAFDQTLAGAYTCSEVEQIILDSGKPVEGKTAA